MRHLLLSFWVIAAGLGLTTSAQAQTAEDCKITGITDANWLHPDPASQLGTVPNGAMANKCDFHIFSWQWFTYLMNPSASDPGIRNFENRAIHPVVDLDTCASVQAGVRIDDDDEAGLTAHVMKFVNMPDIPGQAGPGYALYDRNSQIVFYNRRFTANECGLTNDDNFPDASAASSTFPTGKDQVLELKSSWRILGAGDDTSRYLTLEAEIEGIGSQTLGLAGFHIVVNTGLHPEFVWATFEHNDNAPDCTVVLDPTGFNRPQPTNGWSFASQSCNTCIAANYSNGSDLKTACGSQCTFNGNATKPVLDAQGNVELTGTPSDICLDVQYGTPDPAPAGDTQNVADVQFLNTLLVGPGGIITSLPTSDPLAVLGNYYLGGAVWTNFDNLSPATADFDTALTGSIDLANSTLESFTQVDNGFTNGCFSCHGGANSANTAAASHLLTRTAGGAPGLIERCDIKAGPISGQSAAEQICPTVCAAGMGWNGNWTTIASEMSVCGCNACISDN